MKVLRKFILTTSIYLIIIFIFFVNEHKESNIDNVIYYYKFNYLFFASYLILFPINMYINKEIKLNYRILNNVIILFIQIILYFSISSNSLTINKEFIKCNNNYIYYKEINYISIKDSGRFNSKYLITNNNIIIPLSTICASKIDIIKDNLTSKGINVN